MSSKFSEEQKEMAKKIKELHKNPPREIIECMDKRIKELNIRNSYVCNHSCGCCFMNKPMG